MENHYEHLLSTSEKIRSLIEAQGVFKGASASEFVRRLLGGQLVRAYLIFGEAEKDSIHLYSYVLTKTEFLTIKHSERTFSRDTFYVTNSYDRTLLSDILFAEYEHRFSTSYSTKGSKTHTIRLKTCQGEEIKIKLDQEQYFTNDGAGRDENLMFRFISAVNRAIMERPLFPRPTKLTKTEDASEEDYEADNEEDGDD